jgi:hypothetical protein
MSQNSASKISVQVVGKLRMTERDGLLIKGGRQIVSLAIKIDGLLYSMTEALPGALNREWPRLGRYPTDPEPFLKASRRQQRPEAASVWARFRQFWAGTETVRKSGSDTENLMARLELERPGYEEFHRSQKAYLRRLHSSPEYKKATLEFLELQRREPRILPGGTTGGTNLWTYRDEVLRVDSTRDKAMEALQIKHYVLTRDSDRKKLQRRVEFLENLPEPASISREPIPENVRLFVWQRDKGQCVKCSSREKLEFDHIIPVIAGGSNTERNIQLLCEPCNRSKGATI